MNVWLIGCFVPRKDALVFMLYEKQSNSLQIKTEILYCNMVFQRGGCVYIMTNKLHTVLYTGVTSEIISRVWQHKTKFYPDSFTAKYNCNKLVYYCFYPHIEEAIAAEKAIKGGNRRYKKQLVDSINPEWKDLYDDLIKE
jgi:putative endonuclease